MSRTSQLITLTFSALLLAAAQAVFAAEAMTDARAADTVAIQQLIVKYAHAYDSFDIEGYVGVFAEDAHFTFNGGDLKGRDAIRQFITGAKQRNEAAEGPVVKTFHSITNTLVEFDSPTTAHQRSYWQVLQKGSEDEPVIVANAGYYDDTLTKQDGQWLIQTRNIP